MSKIKYINFLSFLLIFMPAAQVKSTEIRINCFLVTEGEIVLADLKRYDDRQKSKKNLALANSGHQIKNGHQNIFILRKFEDDGTGVDVQIFSKITLELKDKIVNLQEGNSKYIDISHSYFSSGGVGFIDRGNYWIATDPIKNILISLTKKGMMARIQSKFAALYVADQNQKNINIDISCPVDTIKVKKLNQWLGAIGTSWSSFAPND